MVVQRSLVLPLKILEVNTFYDRGTPAVFTLLSLFRTSRTLGYLSAGFVIDMLCHSFMKIA
jgi:hypothetical protein